MRLWFTKKRIAILITDAVLLILAFNVKSIALLMGQNQPRCGFEQMGIICPSCGSTSCIYRLAKGDFVSAFLFNPMLFIILLYFGVVMVMLNLWCLFNLKFAEKVWKFMLGYVPIFILAGLYLVIGFARNLF